MIKEGNEIQETRQGVFFTGDIIRNNSGQVYVLLFLEGQDKPVGEIGLDDMEVGDKLQSIDAAFQKWVKSGWFYKTINDLELLSILEVAQHERLRNVLWYNKAFRFVLAKDSSYEKPRFILTSDKSDLPSNIMSLNSKVVSNSF